MLHLPRLSSPGIGSNNVGKQDIKTCQGLYLEILEEILNERVLLERIYKQVAPLEWLELLWGPCVSRVWFLKNRRLFYLLWEKRSRKQIRRYFLWVPTLWQQAHLWFCLRRIYFVPLTNMKRYAHLQMCPLPHIWERKM